MTISANVHCRICSRALLPVGSYAATEEEAIAAAKRRLEDGIEGGELHRHRTCSTTCLIALLLLRATEDGAGLRGGAR